MQSKGYALDLISQNGRDWSIRDKNLDLLYLT